jgi:hypothetical protein
MRISARCLSLVSLVLLLICLAPSGYAQNPIPPGSLPDMGQRAPINMSTVVPFNSSIIIDADTGAAVNGAAGPGWDGIHGVNDDPSNTKNTSKILGVNTLTTFFGEFAAQAGPDAGKDYKWSMIGNEPEDGDTTKIPAKITEVSLQLLNADGSVFTTVPFSPFHQLTLNSPNFEDDHNYRTGNGLQYEDAIHRAQFFNSMDSDWHTILVPKVVNKVTITVPFFVNVQLRNGNVIQARSYFTGTASDGSTFVLMLSPLFNFFYDNLVVNDINLGNFTTNAINMDLFPNTFLFNLNQNNPNVPGGCCTLGFHTFFLNAGFPESRWVSIYASWISPGLFGAGFQDVTALTHEIAESFGNPFVDNSAPNWQFPGQPANAAVCQNNLEEGDPIEVLANATTTISITEGKFSFTYHPQNIPLLQWFTMGATSNAVDGAFSFPDETVLPHSALPCPNGVG